MAKAKKEQPVQQEEAKFLNLDVGGEIRQYDITTLSEKAVQKVNVMNFDSQTVVPVLIEVLRLAQLGLQIDSRELTALLPQSGYNVVKTDENAVESKEE